MPQFRTLSASVAALALAAGAAAAQEAHRHAVEGGEVVIHPIQHASMVLETPAGVIYVDPVEGADRYADLPAPDAILLTHEHGDHFDTDTLNDLAEAPMIVNQAVFDQLPEEMQARATVMANGDSGDILGAEIEAIPAYNTTEDRLQFHPEGRDNGYVLTVGGMRFLIAGDTEDTPELRALTDIHVAFLPMNLPYTMTVEQAAEAVAAFQPDIVYPYHFGDSDLEEFARLVEASGAGTEVVIAEWYPDADS
ncbi:MBL fold metallo-hydrolase [Paracoccus tibetensis]|uniref:L-ascorbate metabolism protein UlaG, beta-lactamase superfamily n=1 Tax=Paracoccus tibetensis TaxID=336292 RepID=A0A1G5E5Z1_9RHOB|nr:MBL fold metallo-hydrolase [Paracoccus tibetensis]SCY22396.1 L-ascorbate metabolism protein UlaG, beta-lactamase superfamily [Paracoccus tibetensis]